jgi:hypothetical protein
MYICIKCKKEMRCHKNSVGANYGEGKLRPGDVFKCCDCGFELLACREEKIFDPKYVSQDLYFDMIDNTYPVLIKLDDSLKYKNKKSLFSKIIECTNKN